MLVIAFYQKALSDEGETSYTNSQKLLSNDYRSVIK